MPSDDWLDNLADPSIDLDELVDHITVDAYGDEGYWSVAQAIENSVRFPFTASQSGRFSVPLEGSGRFKVRSTELLDRITTAALRGIRSPRPSRTHVDGPVYRLFLRVPIVGIHALKEERHERIRGTAAWSLLRGDL